MALESWQIAALPGANETPPPVPPQTQPQQLFPPPQRSATQIQADLKLHYIKRRRRWILPLLIFVALTLIVSGAALLVQKYRNDPTPLFNQALAESLTTKQVMAMRSGDADTTVTTFDIAQPKDPRLGTLTTKILGADTYVKGYGTLENTYVSFASDPTKKTNTPTNLLDQWISVRDDGNLPTGAAGAPLFSLSDPRSQLLQPWAFGNFDKKTRNDLLSQIKKSKLYEFNSKNVTSSTKNNQTMYVYKVTIDGTKLAAYESKLGAAFGISANDIATSTKTLIGAKLSAEITIDKASKHVTRLDVTNSGITSTTTLQNYNKATLSSEPAARFTYAQYLAQLGATDQQ